MDKFYYRGSNFNDFFNLFSVVSLLLYAFIAIGTKSIACIFFLCSIYIVIIYFLSIYWMNLFYFYDDKVVIYYPIRLRKRRRTIFYNQLKLVRYINTGSRTPSTITFDVYRKESKYLPANSFSSYSYKKRQAILKFINSKGVPIETVSKIEKDKNILD